MHRAVIWAVVRHPSLWGTALGFAWATRRKGWRTGLLSVVGRGGEYERWRVATAYGDPNADLDPEDVIAFLRWRRRQLKGVRG